MKPSSETRLQKLETFHGSRDKRFFVIEGDTQTERDAYIDGLIQSGEARTSDTFIYTGVPRPKSTHKDWGAIPEMRKAHDPRERIKRRRGEASVAADLPCLGRSD